MKKVTISLKANEDYLGKKKQELDSEKKEMKKLELDINNKLR